MRDERDLLLDPSGRELLRFRLVQRAEMGQQRKNGGRSPGFVQSVTGLAEGFYGVLQQIVPWSEKPPQTRPAPPPKELVDEPIAGTEGLAEAMVAARDHADDETGTRRRRTILLNPFDPATPYATTPTPD